MAPMPMRNRVPQQGEVDQRGGVAAGVPEIGEAGGEAEGNGGDAEPLGEDAAAEGFQAEHQAGERGAGEDEAAPVEWVAAGFADVVDVEGDQDDAEDADGDVDVEYGAPGEIVDDEAADWRAEDGAEQGGGREPGHGGDELVFWHGAQEDQAADRDHHGAAHALEDTGGDEFAEGVRLAAQDRAEGEDDDGEAEDLLGAEAVGDPAAGGDENGQGEEIGG